MATYEFLSDDWLAEARAIRAEFEGKGATIEHSIRMNLMVNEVPFGDGSVDAHADTSSGSLVLEIGHIDPSTSPSPSTTTSPRPSWSKATPMPASRLSCRAKSRSRVTSPSSWPFRP